jgi:hypothetical protein
MNRIPVKSSNLKSVGYNAGTLEVEFANGAVWSYANVPAETYKAMTEAPSIGSFFSTTIRGRFEATKVPPPPEKEAMS